MEAELRKLPSMQEVFICECCFSTPRIIMHRWLASTTTPTPCAPTIFCTALATWVVRPLLDLKAPGVVIDDARNLGESDDSAVGNVGHVALADERQQVVLA